MRWLSMQTLVVLILVLGAAVRSWASGLEGATNLVFPYSEQKNIFTRELIFFAVDNEICLEKARRDVVEKFRQESGLSTLRIFRRVRVEFRRESQVSYLRDLGLLRPLSRLYPVILGEVQEKVPRNCAFRYVNIDGTSFVLERKLPADLIRSFDKELLDNRTITFMLFKGVWYIYEGRGFYSPIRIGENMQHRGIFSYSGIGQSIHYVFEEEHLREKCIIDNLGSNRKSQKPLDGLDELRQEFIFRRSLMSPEERAGDERMDMDARQVVILREKIEYDLNMELFWRPEKRNADCSTCKDIFQCPACNMEIFPSIDDIEFNSAAIMQQRGFWHEDSVYPSKTFVGVEKPFFDKMDAGTYSSLCLSKEDTPSGELSALEGHKVNSYFEPSMLMDLSAGEPSELQMERKNAGQHLSQPDESLFSGMAVFSQEPVVSSMESVARPDVSEVSLTTEKLGSSESIPKAKESSERVFSETSKVSQESSFYSNPVLHESTPTSLSKGPEYQKPKALGEKHSGSESSYTSKNRMKSLPKAWMERSSSSPPSEDLSLSTSAGKAGQRLPGGSERSPSLGYTEKSNTEGSLDSEFSSPRRKDQSRRSKRSSERRKKKKRVKRTRRAANRRLLEQGSSEISIGTSETVRRRRGLQRGLGSSELSTKSKRRSSAIRAQRGPRGRVEVSQSKKSKPLGKGRRAGSRTSQQKRHPKNKSEKSNRSGSAYSEDERIPVVRMDQSTESGKVDTLLRGEISRIISQLAPWLTFYLELTHKFEDEVFWPGELRPKRVGCELFSLNIRDAEDLPKGEAIADLRASKDD